MLWIKFAICAAVIVIFGIKLSQAAQHIVKMGRLSEAFMGVFFLALITSFPEISTAIATVTKINAPDLGVGDLIGSVIFNLMIIAILDFKRGKAPILSQVKKDHLVTCGFSLMMLGVLIASLSLGIFSERRIGLLNIGIESFLLIIIYIVAILHTYKYARETELEDTSVGQGSLKSWLLFAIYASIIIGAGFWLASLGKEMVDLKGWDEMYFGTIIIGLTTSLPEIVVTIAAVSMGSVNMGIANILGSNLFDMAIVPLIDAVFRKGYIIDYISASHIYSCLLAILMTTTVLISILYRPKKSFMRLGIGTIMLILIFAIGNFILFNVINT